MQSLLTTFFSSPLTAFGSVLAIAAAIGVLIFLWGLITYFFSTGNVREKTLGNTYMQWGVSLVLLFFLVWEAVRWIVHAISQG